MILTKKPNKEQERKLLDFKKKYLLLYPDYLQEEIDKKLLLGFTNNNDTINQIYSYLNIVEDNINIYKAFIKILDNNFNLKTNILEVGAGTIPILSKYIKEKYNSNLTLIEPNIIFDNILECKILKKEFTLQTDLSNYDLIIGYNPCAATENIIRKSIAQNKEFCIAVCGCCFLPKSYTKRTSQNWHNYLIDLAKELGKDNYDIKILYFDKKFNIDYPIIIGKRKNIKQKLF